MPTFADRLQQLREKAGLTQAQLADASGLPLGSIRNYEQGQREPLWDVIFKLATAMGVSCEAFADCVDGGKKQPPPAKSKKRGRPPP